MDFEAAGFDCSKVLKSSESVGVHNGLYTQRFPSSPFFHHCIALHRTTFGALMGLQCTFCGSVVFGKIHFH